MNRGQAARDSYLLYLKAIEARKNCDWEPVRVALASAVHSWTVEDSDAPRGKTLSVSNGTDASVVALAPGAALLELVVTLTFVKPGLPAQLR